MDKYAASLKKKQKLQDWVKNMKRDSRQESA
jgi:hypothetical protein